MLAGAEVAAVFGLSLLVHELAHAAVARRAGPGVRSITLWLFGGVSELSGPPAAPMVEVRVAVVGPLASLGLAGVLGGGAWVEQQAGAPALVVVAMSWLASVNLVLGGFNLLPGAPLDGGRVLHGMVWRATGDRERAGRVASAAGQVVGGLLAVLGFVLVLRGRWDGLWVMLVGWFLAGTAVSEAAHETLVSRLAGMTAADVMTPDPVVVADWWTVQALVDRLGEPGAPRYRTFPVVDFSGRPMGAVTLDDLARVGPEVRLATAVHRLARPLRAGQLLEPGTPLAAVLDRPGRLLPVVQDDRVVGVITRSDLRRAVVLAELRAGGAGA